MSISNEDIEKIVAEVIKKLQLEEKSFTETVSASSRELTQTGGPIFSSISSAVDSAQKAQIAFQNLGIEKRKKIIDAIRQVSIENAQVFAKMAVEETGMGRIQDKVQKNLLVATKTPGTEDLISKSYTGDKGLTLVEYAPFGVVAAITPSTNPVATIISNAIAILAAGNSVVFSPHPASKKCVQFAIRLINDAIVKSQGPENLVSTIENPNQETTRELLAHPKPKLNLVTGGPAIVKVAMAVGKSCKTIAAGPGNPPIVVDETAIFPDCARDIVTGAGFDNNILCIAEKEVIVVESIKQKFLDSMRTDERAYELNPSQIDELTKKVIVEGGKGCKEPKLNREFVGKTPSFIAKSINLNLSEEVRVLWAEVPNDHPLVWTEQLMPVLPVTFSKDVDSAIELAYLAEGGNHHTAGMYSMDVRNLTKMARKMACSIFVKNAPTLYGLGLGEGYASMSIGTPTGDGITKPTHFVRPLQCSLVGYFRIA